MDTAFLFFAVYALCLVMGFRSWVFIQRNSWILRSFELGLIWAEGMRG
jgi:hypothetical protein